MGRSVDLTSVDFLDAQLLRIRDELTTELARLQRLRLSVTLLPSEASRIATTMKEIRERLEAIDL